ncbi:MAG TPA: helicase C-terminal domain-containing protein [Bacteroidota bacterium]|nr:helicase C-terminal domain-containing protein [Bacteroidota bacterium]
MTPDLHETVHSIFSAGGALALRQGFDVRPQQGKMASAVASALSERRHLIVEAPTGVGKTLGYLVPSLLYAVREGGKAVISTHTKNLQEQLLQKDFPIAHSVTGTQASVAILKGRRNYLCTTRLEHTIGIAPSLFDEEGLRQLARIRDWSLHTRDGDAEGLAFTPRPDVWDAVCSEQGVCSSGLCGTHCFFQRAKQRAREAAVVILNHALFFSLLAIGGGEEQYLFPDDFVIFDEAHTLEGVAGAGIGLKVSHRQAVLAIRKFHHPGTNKGLLPRRKKKNAALCARAEAAADAFFALLGQTARALAADSAREGGFRHEIRVRNPGIVADSLGDHFAALEAAARAAEEDSGDMFRAQEIAAARTSLQSVRTGVTTFLEQLDRDLTYWVELPPGGSTNVTLCAAHSDISRVLGPRLFRDGSSVIMTSATLSVNGSLGYFQNRVGALNTEGLILDSPFDHARQMTLSIAGDIAEPETERYSAELPGWILRSIDRTHGKALVLFTSVTSMRSAASALAGEIAGRGLTLMVQGLDGQRHQLLEEFKRDIHSVLFGLDSFWMGVDVPGEALEHVIITRLPFAFPNHPLIEARLEEIAARGGNSFMEYTLPEALLKFKQGAGRLIRTQEDRGIVTILDSRIVKKGYGRAFISSLPRCPVEVHSSEGGVEYMEPYDP